MKLEDQVCSLELSKRLKELGVKQNSYFYHYNEPYNDGQHEWMITNWSDYETACQNKGEPYSALTVAELGEILPKTIFIATENEEQKIFSNFRFVTGTIFIVDEKLSTSPFEVWSVNYICDTTNEFRNWLFDTLLTPPIYDKKEADARAKILIYLIENKLMELKNEH